MTYYDTQQQYLNNPQFNPQQWAPFSSHAAWLNTPSMQAIGGYGLGGYGLGGYGLGQAAYGQQYGQYGGQPPTGAFGYNPGWAAQPQWGGLQQRQLSQQDVSEVVRQLVPALPQILAQAQAQSPYAAIGYAAYGQAPRTLSQQDVNEVVRQILPIVPQIVGMPAEPAAAAICGHAGRPRLGSIRARKSFAELRRAIWRAAIPVGVRRSDRWGTTTAIDPTGCRGCHASAYRGDPPGDREPAGFQPAAHDLIATACASLRVPTGDCRLPKAAVAAPPSSTCPDEGE